MAITKSFTVQSTQRPSIDYFVTIHDTVAVGRETNAVCAIVRCDGFSIATILGWLQHDGSINLPDLNVGDRMAINKEHVRAEPPACPNDGTESVSIRCCPSGSRS